MVLLMGAARGEIPQLWKWSDDEGETEQGSRNTITWAEASKMDETPTVGYYAQKPAAAESSLSSTAQPTSSAGTPLGEDEDWMNLDNDKSDSRNSQKKKASKKKK